MKIFLDTSKREKRILRVNNEEFETEGSIFGLLIKKVKNPKDIERVEFNPGPGDSFTGLKVGASIANAINYALEKIKPSEVKLPKYGKEPNIG
ncbi:MAG: hypothetical protein ABH814_02905 [bacterium]